MRFSSGVSVAPSEKLNNLAANSIRIHFLQDLRGNAGIGEHAEEEMLRSDVGSAEFARLFCTQRSARADRDH